MMLAQTCCQSSDAASHPLSPLGAVGGAGRVPPRLPVLIPKGTLVIVGGEGGGRWFGIGRQLQAMMLSPFVSQKLGTFVMSPKQENLAVLRQFIEFGKLTPVIDRTYSLSETPTVVQYMTDDHARRKVVINV
jgi:NADPH:quinone reductase-like Zn-dependent oxidoreductase